MIQRYFTQNERDVLDIHGKIDAASRVTSLGFFLVTTMGWVVSVGVLKREHFRHVAVPFLEWVRVLLNDAAWFVSHAFDSASHLFT